MKAGISLSLLLAMNCSAVAQGQKSTAAPVFNIFELMYAAIDKVNPDRWYLYEIYASEEAYQAYRRTPHFKEYIELTAEMTTYKEAIAIAPGKLENKGGLIYEIK